MPRLTNANKVVKYIRAREQGHNKKKSKEIAGYSPNSKTTMVEQSDGYKSLSVKSALLQQITMEELATEHLKNVRQDEDKGAKNKAIELAYERIEPEMQVREDEDKVVVILKGKKE